MSLKVLLIEDGQIGRTLVDGLQSFGYEVTLLTSLPDSPTDAAFLEQLRNAHIVVWDENVGDVVSSKDFIPLAHALFPDKSMIANSAESTNRKLQFEAGCKYVSDGKSLIPLLAAIDKALTALAPLV